MSDQEKSEGLPTGFPQGHVPDWRPTFSGSLQAYHQQCLDNIRQRMPNIAASLCAAGIASVQVEYDGCGDSGQIESLRCLGTDGEPVELMRGRGPSEETLKDLFYDIVECRYAGWENDDGACGELVWVVADNRLTHAHHERYTEYRSTDVEDL